MDVALLLSLVVPLILPPTVLNLVFKLNIILPHFLCLCITDLIFNMCVVHISIDSIRLPKPNVNR